MTKTLTRLPPRVAAVIDALNRRLALYDKLPWTGDRTVVIFGEAVVVRPRWHPAREWWGVEVVKEQGISNRSTGTKPPRFINQ